MRGTDTEATEQDTVFGSVHSGSEPSRQARGPEPVEGLCALCGKKIAATKAVICSRRFAGFAGDLAPLPSSLILRPAVVTLGVPVLQQRVIHEDKPFRLPRPDMSPLT